jgi:hypothetical protein
VHALAAMAWAIHPDGRGQSPTARRCETDILKHHQWRLMGHLVWSCRGKHVSRVQDWAPSMALKKTVTVIVTVFGTAKLCNPQRSQRLMGYQEQNLHSPKRDQGVGKCQRRHLRYNREIRQKCRRICHVGVGKGTAVKNIFEARSPAWEQWLGSAQLKACIC